jgi:hypothetical protein
LFLEKSVHETEGLGFLPLKKKVPANLTGTGEKITVT